VIVPAAEDAGCGEWHGDDPVQCARLADKDVTATELDNDVLAIVNGSRCGHSARGLNERFEVKLSAQPGADVEVSVSRIAGDTERRSSSVVSLIFTPSNWDTYQTVVLTALEDADGPTGQRRSGAVRPGRRTSMVVATEQDNDILAIGDNARCGHSARGFDGRL